MEKFTIDDEEGFLDQFQNQPVGRKEENYQSSLSFILRGLAYKKITNVSPLRAISMLTNNSLATDRVINFCT